MKKTLLWWFLSIFLAFDVAAQNLDYSKPILATIIGIENDQNSPAFNPINSNLPLFGLYDQNHTKNTYDRNSPEWWDNLIEELQFSRVHVAMPLSRGCYAADDELSGTPANLKEDGNGNACPRVLTRLADALSRNQVPEGGLRFAYFDDTASYPHNAVYPQSAIDPVTGAVKLLDITNRDLTLKLMWDRNMKVFFDTVPRKYWYLDEKGQPLITIWSKSFFSNVDSAHTANVNVIFENLRWLFHDRYGVYPTIYLHRDWIDAVPNINREYVQGAYGWTDPQSGMAHGFYTWNGIKMGTVSPGFRRQFVTDDKGNVIYQNNHPVYFERGCGSPCWEVSREHGKTFYDGMSEAYGSKDGVAAKLVLIEGFANIPESAGFYRSTGADYDFPNQYLNRLREWADPNPSEITFQAEASDYRQGNNMSGNQGGKYSNDDLDVGKLSGPGYYVGWVSPGEVIGFKRVKLPAKPFEIRINTATALDRRAVKVTFERQRDSQTDAQSNSEDTDTTYGPWTMPIPNTGSLSTFKETQIAVFRPAPGYYNIKIEMPTDGLNIDWLKIREVNVDCSAEYPGIENVVGLNNGTSDQRFLCKNRQWYSCGWDGTGSWVTNAQSGQIVGDFQCNASAAQWKPLSNSCSDTYSGTDNVVGLSNGTGDQRFLCKDHRWYSCNWGTNASWVTNAQLNQTIGSYRCDGVSWLRN